MVVSKHVLGELVSEVVIPDANPAYYFFPYLPYSAYFVLGYFFFPFRGFANFVWEYFPSFQWFKYKKLGS